MLANFFWISCFPANASLNCTLSFVYSTDAFKQNSAAPNDPHAIPYLAILRHENGPLKLWTWGSILFSSTKTSSIKIWPVTEALNENLPSSLGVVKPLQSLSTIKPLNIPSSSFAQIIKTSAIGELVIQVFEPFRIKPPSTCLAFVFIDAGSEPASGSVRPKHPIKEPEAIFGK